jgi:hypothetical protein
VAGDRRGPARADAGFVMDGSHAYGAFRRGRFSGSAAGRFGAGAPRARIPPFAAPYTAWGHSPATATARARRPDGPPGYIPLWEGARQVYGYTPVYGPRHIVTWRPPCPRSNRASVYTTVYPYTGASLVGNDSVEMASRNRSAKSKRTTRNSRIVTKAGREAVRHNERRRA